MGLILDLAVIGVTIVVLGSLALLAWTLALGGSRAASDGRARMAALRAAAERVETQMRRGARERTGDAGSE